MSDLVLVVAFPTAFLFGVFIGARVERERWLADLNFLDTTPLDDDDATNRANSDREN
jgi:hypothetical protein